MKPQSNRAINLVVPSLILATATFLGSSLDSHAQGNIVRANESVTQEYTQSSAGGPASTGEYRFILNGESNSRNIIQFIRPDATATLGANQVYESFEVLQTANPPGTYTAQLDHQVRAIDPYTRHTLQADFPSNLTYHSEVPTITNDEWSNGVLVVDPNFTLSIAPWEGRPSDSMIRLRVQGPEGVLTRTVYGQDLTSVTFGGVFSLQPNSTYQVQLGFVDFFETVSTPIPGTFPMMPDQFRFELGSGNTTRFTIVTVPEPKVWALFVTGGMFIAWCRIRRVA